MTQPLAATNNPDGTRHYTVPHRETGELFDLPNITGIIGLADPKHLCDYRFKIGILGVALRDDIRALIAAANLLPAGPPRNGELRRVGALAETAGGIIEKGYDPGDLGTAKHSLTERLDELVPAGAVNLVDELGLPKDLRDIACEYVAAMAGVDIVLTEVTVASFLHRYAGTGDRIIRFRPLDVWRSAFDQYDLGRGCFVLDNKFGKVHTREAGMQLAAIANAETIWDAEAQTHTPLPDDLRRDIGFIFNPDKGLIPVPLAGAFEAFCGLCALKRYDDGDAISAGGAATREGADSNVSDAGVGAAASPATAADARRGAPPAETPAFDPTCTLCDTTRHLCPGCGTDVPHGRVACEACSPEPVRIAEVLPRAIAAIPETDPFAGCPDDDGKPQADRVAKRAWLIERIDVLREIPNGVETLAARWPTGVPTFKQSPVHSLDQLDVIAKAITAAEAQVQAPFPEAEDPTDPRTIKVPIDDPRVLDVVARLALLPPDLLAAVGAEARKAKVPKLTGGRLTEDRLTVITDILAAAEEVWAPRAKAINDALELAESYGISETAVCAALGVPSPRHIFDDRLVGLVGILSDAICLPDRILVERDGVLVVDNPAAVLAAHGDSRKAVWDAGREAAKANGIESPKDSDAALFHPVLTAVLAAI